MQSQCHPRGHPSGRRACILKRLSLGCGPMGRRKWQQCVQCDKKCDGTIVTCQPKSMGDNDNFDRVVSKSITPLFNMPAMRQLMSSQRHPEAHFWQETSIDLHLIFWIRTNQSEKKPGMQWKNELDRMSMTVRRILQIKLWCEGLRCMKGCYQRLWAPLKYSADAPKVLYAVPFCY